jgi:4-diphosphocytidyl-2-C-methyl-D-erythritol kinase
MAAPRRQDDPAIALAEGATSEAGMPDAGELIDALRRSDNDLQAPAISLHPVVADVLDALRTLPGCRLARMSGSGATCFGLFDMARVADAARELTAKHPGWWIAPTNLG